MKNDLLPVILCGGSGTRLWPLSRESYPKQFLALTGSDTMLQQTATRMSHLSPGFAQVLPPVVVCNEAHRFLVASQLMEADVRQPTILLEPTGRNTAPALTLAALQASSGGGDPVLLAMPSDHVMADRPQFAGAVELAYEAADRGCLITFGVAPDSAHAGYGYIRHGALNELGVHPVESFTEKPDPVRARQYLESGNYLWNSGIFMLRASVWLKAIEHCRPDIWKACIAAMQGAKHDLDFIRPDPDFFNASPSDSIDYAVMERSKALGELGISSYAVPLQAGWSDVGDWDSLWKASHRDSDGNALLGEAVLQNGCSNSMLLANSRLVVGVGLDNVIVVETADAVLVADKNCAQDIKNLVEQLAQSGHSPAHHHRKVHRPWGWYDCIDGGEHFQVKRIVVNAGASLSLQKHLHRAEHWVVVQGRAQVTNGEETYFLNPNQSTYIPVGSIHRLSNPGSLPLEIIEVQSGDYLGEDDILRFDDIYGRPVASV